MYFGRTFLNLGGSCAPPRDGKDAAEGGTIMSSSDGALDPPIHRHPNEVSSSAIVAASIPGCALSTSAAAANAAGAAFPAPRARPPFVHAAFFPADRSAAHAQVSGSSPANGNPAPLRSTPTANGAGSLRSKPCLHAGRRDRPNGQRFPADRTPPIPSRLSAAAPIALRVEEFSHGHNATRATSRPIHSATSRVARHISRPSSFPAHRTPPAPCQNSHH
jgi:hypothetical protein